MGRASGEAGELDAGGWCLNGPWILGVSIRQADGPDLGYSTKGWNVVFAVDAALHDCKLQPSCFSFFWSVNGNKKHGEVTIMHVVIMWQSEH
jgi:hypothetical protein